MCDQGEILVIHSSTSSTVSRHCSKILRTKTEYFVLLPCSQIKIRSGRERSRKIRSGGVKEALHGCYIVNVRNVRICWREFLASGAESSSESISGCFLEVQTISFQILVRRISPLHLHTGVGLRRDLGFPKRRFRKAEAYSECPNGSSTISQE